MLFRPDRPSSTAGPQPPARRSHMTYATDRWGALDFRVALPETWAVDLPQTHAPEFGSSPSWFVPLMRACDADGGMRLEVGARPMRATDRLIARAIALMAHQAIELEQPLDEWPMGLFSGLCGHGWIGHAEHRRPVRVAFLDEARRIVQLMLVGQAACVDAMQAMWPTVLRTFRLLPRTLGAPAPMASALAQMQLGSD